jgi:DNA-binding XRE family transcriptional regulator
MKRYKLNGKTVQAVAATDLPVDGYRGKGAPDWFCWGYDRNDERVQVPSSPCARVGVDAFVLLDDSLYVLPLSALEVEKVDRSPGGLIREAREREGWTHSELADFADVPVKSVRAIESGGEIDPTHVYRIDEALGLKGCYLDGYHDGWHARGGDLTGPDK